MLFVHLKLTERQLNRGSPCARQPVHTNLPAAARTVLRQISSCVWLPSALLWLLLSAGCGAASSKPAPATPARSEERILLPRIVVTPTSARSIDELMTAADAALEARDYERAARQYLRIFELAPDGEHAERALFGAGTAHDLAAQHFEAVRRYESLIGRFPQSGLARTALVRSTRLYGFLEQWQRAGERADAVLARYAELRPFELVTLYGAKALALVERQDDEKASYYVEKARSIIEAERLDAAGEIPRDLAQVYYALGEIRRLRAARIKFVPRPENFGRALEQRCQYILDAQSSYSDAMRAHDAHWSAMAGYRVGQLYQELHEDLMVVPAPESADSEPRKLLFEGAMRLRYSILLHKARSMMEHTLKMAQRTEERSPWVTKAERAKQDLEQAAAREQAALDALPYSRQQLEQALEDLQRRASSSQ